MEPEIVTERLHWRRTRAEDLAALHALVSDFDVVKMTATWPWPPDRAFTESRAVPFDLETGLVGQVLCGDTLVGMMGISAGKDPGIGEMGYMFGRAYWGRGYATEIGHALIGAAWARYDWRAIKAIAFDDNPASGRVLEKLGFGETGHGEGPSAARGATSAVHSFRLMRP